MKSTFFIARLPSLADRRSMKTGEATFQVPNRLTRTTTPEENNNKSASVARRFEHSSRRAAISSRRLIAPRATYASHLTSPVALAERHGMRREQPRGRGRVASRW
jgi:hypothetical protein